MTQDPIFAGKLSLTDDIPGEPAVFERADPERLDRLVTTYAKTRASSLSDLMTVEQASSELDRMQAERKRMRFPQTTFNQVKWDLGYIRDTYGQPPPLPEPGLSPAAQRVRAEAARLGIDYDAEVAKVLHSMKAAGLRVAPNPWSAKAGPDPLKNVSDEARYQAEKAAVETIKRERGVQLTWQD